MSNYREKFMEVYSVIKSELLNDPAFEFTDDSREWMDQMMDYNVPRGKLFRGLSVIDSYKILMEGRELTNEEIHLTCALGWCTEWLQAYLLVVDDMMDHSYVRRGQPCWFRLPKVGMIAANDSFILSKQVPRIIKKHFKGKPYYVQLLELFDEVEYQTVFGQMLDVITTGEKDLSKYSSSLQRRIAQYKSSYYSLYLPVACALLMAGENLDNHVSVKDILTEMGIYYQVQNDYLDSFGDEQVTGKIGTDIEEFKCSWVVVKALQLCSNNEDQKKSLYENYGKKDPICISKVKDLYNDLNSKDAFMEYESKVYQKLIKDIEALPSKAVQSVLKSYLSKIYMWQK